MKRERIYLYDTTLRDGQQTQGVNFTVDNKIHISKALDDLGIDYVEGGWPGANPTDSDFFDTKPKLKATFTAFGMTKRSGKSAENDEVLSAVLNANTPGVCLVGKTHDFHVTKALGITLEENLKNISDSVRHIVSKGREALFDCEHFFDGYRENPKYALKAAKAAYDAGARWVVLCDTNGGALPAQIFSATKAVIDTGIPGKCIGIHTHDDTEHAVANSLAAIDAGARQVQGTLNGLGERCGNANLVTLIPTLLLKEPYSSLYETGIEISKLNGLTSISRTLDDIPTIVGNERIIPMSNQAGQSNLKKRLMDAGLQIEKGDSRLSEILNAIKEREDRGYAYDSAQASFELIARKILGQLPTFFEIKRYRVTVEKRKNKYGKMVSLSEAVVVAKIGKNKVLSVSESMDPECGDQGPVNALSKALAKDLGPYQNCIDDMTLTDYKVRITGSGTDAVTRVIIDSQDGQGRRWSTVGVSANIVDASFEALLDAINWKLIRDGMKPE